LDGCKSFIFYGNVRYHILETAKLTDPFENVKNQIGFCGIWCGSCAGGNGSIAELAKKLQTLAKDHGLEHWIPKEFDFKEFTKGLTCIQARAICPGCKQGGGPPTCKIRICALRKGFGDCSQCNLLAECGNFEDVEKSHPEIKEDLRKIAGADRRILVEQWLAELKTKWPHCIIFCDATNK
jgi:hypothetical protein